MTRAPAQAQSTLHGVTVVAEDIHSRGDGALSRVWQPHDRAGRSSV